MWNASWSCWFFWTFFFNVVPSEISILHNSCCTLTVLSNIKCELHLTMSKHEEIGRDSRCLLFLFSFIVRKVNTATVYMTPAWVCRKPEEWFWDGTLQEELTQLFLTPTICFFLHCSKCVLEGKEVSEHADPHRLLRVPVQCGMLLITRGRGEECTCFPERRVQLSKVWEMPTLRLRSCAV